MSFYCLFVFSLAICIVCFLYFSHSNRHTVLKITDIVWIYVSLMTGSVVCVFLCVFAGCIFVFGETCVFRLWLSQVTSFSLLSVRRSFCTLSSLPDMCFAYHFSQFTRWLFILPAYFAKKILILVKSCFPIMLLWIVLLISYLKTCHQTSYPINF